MYPKLTVIVPLRHRVNGNQDCRVNDMWLVIFMVGIMIQKLTKLRTEETNK